MIDPVLDAPDPEQRWVVALLNRPLVVLARTGTEETRTTTHRVAYAVQEGRYAPAAALTVTPATRAAGELKL